MTQPSFCLALCRIFPELNSNDMILCIVKGVNLPAPPGTTMRGGGCEHQSWNWERLPGVGAAKLPAGGTVCHPHVSPAPRSPSQGPIYYCLLIVSDNRPWVLLGMAPAVTDAPCHSRLTIQSVCQGHCQAELEEGSRCRWGVWSHDCHE